MGLRDLLKLPDRAKLAVKLLFGALALIIVLLGIIIWLIATRT
jgi:hypothetical protein